MLAYVSDPSKCLIILANARGGSTHPIMDCRVLALEAWLALAASAASTMAAQTAELVREREEMEAAKALNAKEAEEARHAMIAASKEEVRSILRDF